MKQYKSITDFWKDFSTREACFEHLISLKWSNGFSCRKCGCQKSYKGKLWYYRKCADCDYDESCTAHTLFHKIKFPIEKGFMMLYLITTMKKGISTSELSRQFDISQKAAWFFKRKVQQAMGAEQDVVLERFIEIDETLVGGREAGMPGRSLGKKLIVQVGIETGLSDHGKKIIKRAKAVLLNGYRSDDIKEGVLKIASPGSLVTTDGLASYNAIEDKFGHKVLLSKKGSNFLLLHWHIFNIKNWTKGTHHHISKKHATNYLNEYHYRFNNRNFIKSKLKDIIKTMLETP